MKSDPVAVTRPLLEALLELARDREPDPVSVALATRPAGDLEPTDGPGARLETLSAATPVFADFSFPDAGGAVNRVFGVDLGRPAGTTQGRFVSHPRGDTALATTDDLAPHVFVAVPPWTLDDVRAYDRGGVRTPITVLAAASPATAADEDVTEGL